MTNQHPIASPQLNEKPHFHEWPIGKSITYHHLANPDVIYGPVLVVDIDHSADRLIVSDDSFTGKCYGLMRLVNRFKVVTITAP